MEHLGDAVVWFVVRVEVRVGELVRGAVKKKKEEDGHDIPANIVMVSMSANLP